MIRAAALSVMLAAALASAADLEPPMAVRKRATTTHHGTELHDDYRWLERLSDPAVKKHLQKENAYSASKLAVAAPLQQQLFAELTELSDVVYDDPPERYRSYCYSKHYDPKVEHAVLFRQKDCDGEREILLDLNVQKGKSAFISLGDWDVSRDETQFAYSVDLVGNERHTLFVKHIKSGKPVTKPIRNVSGFAFADDNILFYTSIEPATMRPHRLYRRNLATPARPDVLVYEEKDPAFSLDLDSSRSDRLLMLTSASYSHNEVRILPRDRPLDAWRVVNRRDEKIYAYVEDRGETLYILTDRESPNFQLCRAPLQTPTSDQWETIWAHDADALIENLVVLQNFTAITLQRAGRPEILVFDAADQKLRTITYDQPVFELELARNLDYRATTVRYSYETPVEPPRYEDIEPTTGEINVVWRMPVPSYNPARYGTVRIWVPSHDKTRIPVTLFFRKDRESEEPQPMLLRGYGAYGESYGYGFSTWLIPLLNRGMVVARAHVRGGSELGRAWHEAGRRRNKPNSFEDLIAVEEALIARGYTTADQLIVSGGSAGGLLVAAALNLRPELCRAAMLDVPFVDVLGSMLNPKLPLSVEERLEWGDPTNKDDFLLMRSYSPYQNLKPQAYPTVLLRTAVNDARVMYWEPVKYAARLRSLSTSGNPVLVHIDTSGAGHLGRSGRTAARQETAEELAFYLWALDHPRPTPLVPPP